jgi:hypothetical protein
MNLKMVTEGAEYAVRSSFKSGSVDTTDFVSRYFRRLGIDPRVLDAHPSLRNLQLLQQAHLEAIPFEKIAEHRKQSPDPGDHLQKIVDSDRAVLDARDSEKDFG